MSSMTIIALEAALNETKLKLHMEREQAQMTQAEYESSLLNT